jgi:putative glycosyltransferase (TIGR04372 family)
MQLILRYAARKAYPFAKLIIPILRGDHHSGFRTRTLHTLMSLGRGAARGISRVAPGWSSIRLANGLFDAVSGNYDEAMPHFAAAVRGGAHVDIIYHYLGVIEMELGYYAIAERLFTEALKLQPYWANTLISLGQVRLALGAEQQALASLLKAIALDPKYGMAHQNLAARYDRQTYRPSKLDKSGRAEVALYDAYNLAGERLIHLGRATDGVRCYTNALKQQQKLARDFELPAHLQKALTRKSRFDPCLPVRILGYEWVTQIGHLGYIASYLKMQRLGWRPTSNVVLLAPKHKIANPAFLKLYRNSVVIVSEPNLISKLFPYQRHLGDTFNGWLRDDGTGEDWCEAGARAHRAWDEKGLPPLLAPSEAIVENGFQWLEAHGVPKGGWFVAMHARSSGFYREGLGSSQGHRNASIASYFPAIREITRRGGWVVRMGDASMPKLPQMPNVIDYAHSRMKRDWLDVFFWSKARFFLGTTSGPTNAVMALFTPTVLVNCLSNYAQLWNNRTIYCLKPFWSKPKRQFVPIAEFTSHPMRGKIFNIDILAQEGVFPQNNTAQDIEEAVAEMLDHLDAGTLPRRQDASVLDGSGSDPALWGNAHPCRSFFERNRSKFF